jgi:two-component system chemotaxis response regulator CheB
LSAGALAVVEKPAGFFHRTFDAISKRLCAQLAAMSRVKLVRQRFNHSRRSRLPCATPKLALHERSSELNASRIAVQDCQILGLVASTGGPHALEVVLSQLGSDFSLPIMLVQHITASFQESFISWLNHICPLPVCEARQDDTLQPGHVYVAPMNRHLLVESTRLRLDGSGPVCGHCPSGTVLFQSLAESFGSQAIGVLLTGMGEDGAEGLLAMKQAGAYTIAEHESSAVINGMPGAARRLGAQCISLPLPAIAGAIRQLAHTTVENNT